MWWMGVDTETVTDRGSSNIVLAVTLFLVVAGIGLSVITWWFWRNTHPDPEALAPLDIMSGRKFRDHGPIEQRRLLDAARPDTTTTSDLEPPIVVNDTTENVDDEWVDVDDEDDDFFRGGDLDLDTGRPVEPDVADVEDEFFDLVDRAVPPPIDPLLGR
jgi:hypothetical protein